VDEADKVDEEDDEADIEEEETEAGMVTVSS